jgi:hypothetical protein
LVALWFWIGRARFNRKVILKDRFSLALVHQAGFICLFQSLFAGRESATQLFIVLEDGERHVFSRFSLRNPEDRYRQIGARLKRRIHHLPYART